MAEAFLQAATQAPHPMQAAASMARSDLMLFNRHGMGIGGIAGSNRNISPCLDNCVESRTVDHQVAKYRECPGTPGFDDDCRFVLEPPHVHLANRDAFVRAMRPAIDVKTAGPANPFPAIMLKPDRHLEFVDKTFIEDIEHFKKRAIRRDI